MAKYTILSITSKTSTTGKPYAVVQLTDDSGAEFRASMWDNFADLAPNSPIEGTVEQKGTFTNFRRAGAALQRPAFYKPKADIAAAQETKKTNIEEAQNRKHDAIARAGAMRDATLVTLASLKDAPFPTTEDFKAEWTRWVKFFLGKADEPFV